MLGWSGLPSGLWQRSLLLCLGFGSFGHNFINIRSDGDLTRRKGQSCPCAVRCRFRLLLAVSPQAYAVAMRFLLNCGNL
jgi:hypothetical protein